MALITTLIMVAIHSFIVELMREDKQLLNLRSWAQGLNRVWGPNGMFTAIIPGYLEYFRPEFHPWDHHTEFLLNRWRKLLGFNKSR